MFWAAKPKAGRVCVHVALPGIFSLLLHMPGSHQTSLQNASPKVKFLRILRWPQKNVDQMWGPSEKEAQVIVLLVCPWSWPCLGVCSSAVGSHEVRGESSEDSIGGSSVGLGPLECLSKISASLDNIHVSMLFSRNIHVNPQLIHVNVWQKPLQYCEVISLQLIKINGKIYIYQPPARRRLLMLVVFFLVSPALYSIGSASS